MTRRWIFILTLWPLAFSVSLDTGIYIQVSPKKIADNSFCIFQSQPVHGKTAHPCMDMCMSQGKSMYKVTCGPGEVGCRAVVTFGARKAFFEWFQPCRTAVSAIIAWKLRSCLSGIRAIETYGADLGSHHTMWWLTNSTLFLIGCLLSVAVVT